MDWLSSALKSYAVYLAGVLPKVEPWKEDMTIMEREYILGENDARITCLAAFTGAVAGGQQYSIGSRALTRANAKEIRENITYWNGWVQRLQNSDSGGMRIRGGTPT